MKLGLIISNDWELFGDGSGDYFDIQHKPLEALLNTIENHGAKLTVMAEVGQQWAHEKIANKEVWANEVVDSWESILKETIKRKSDVQLHLHPQWLNAEYIDKKWKVDLSQWAISSLTDLTLANILKKGKQYLDKLLQPVDPYYECIAFRAGAYCIEPSNVVIEKLLESGIICDSSVTKGLYHPQFYDYRDAHSNVLPWIVHQEDIKYRGNTKQGLLEIPIYSYESVDSVLMRKLVSGRVFDMIRFGVRLTDQDRNWRAEKNRIMRQRYPVNNRPFRKMDNGPRRGLSLRSLLSKLITRTSIKLDYDNLPPGVFVNCIQKIYKNKTMKSWKDTDVIIPVMASGHVKTMHNCENIDRILSLIKHNLNENVVYWTLRQAIKYWLKICSGGMEQISE